MVAAAVVATSQSSRMSLFIGPFIQAELSVNVNVVCTDLLPHLDLTAAIGLELEQVLYP